MEKPIIKEIVVNESNDDDRDKLITIIEKNCKELLEEQEKELLKIQEELMK